MDDMEEETGETEQEALDEELAVALHEGETKKPDFSRAEERLKRGADPNWNYSAWIGLLNDALLWAYVDADQIVEFLLRHGLDPRAHEGRVGVSGLCALRWKGTPAVMRAAKLLLEAGADPTLPVDPTAHDGKTCLQDLWTEVEYNRWFDSTIMGFDAGGVAACATAFANGEPIDGFRSFMEVDGKRIDSVKFTSRREREGSGSGPGVVLYGEYEHAHTFDGLVALCCEGATLVATPELVFYCNEAALKRKGTRTEDISRFFPGAVGKRIRGIYCVQHSKKCPDSVLLDLGENTSLWFSVIPKGGKNGNPPRETKYEAALREKGRFDPGEFEEWQVPRVL